MTPRLACADFSFPLLAHRQALDLIATLGFEGVDIAMFARDGHLDPSVELAQMPRAAAKLKAKLHACGLKLADIFLIPGPNFGVLAPNHPDRRVRRKAREQFVRVVEYTLRAGGKHISALPGIPWKGEGKTDSLQRSAEELAWRAEYADTHGLVYSVEPHIGSIISRLLEVKTLLQMTPKLTLTLDYGHFTRAGISDRAIEPLVRHASHFHCRGAYRGCLQAPFKTNTIDFGRILQVMGETGYRGYVTMEYTWSEWERCNQTDNLSETILFRDFLRGTAGEKL
jgi:sugar phosphate isomerase/epimerase